VRFVLEFARHTKTDPLYVGLTFAQWCSIFVFVLCGYFAYKIAKHGTPHPFKEELDGIVGGKKVTLEQLAKRKEEEASGEAPKKKKKKKEKDEKKAEAVVDKQDDDEKKPEAKKSDDDEKAASD
jgi:hypothetical protein